MALHSYALTTLAGVKSQLGITGSDDDDWLTELINASTDKIERYAGRRFAATDYVEWLNGAGESSVVLGQYPIIRINAVSTALRDVIEVQYTGDSIHTTATVTATGIRLSTMDAAGTATTETVDWATYKTASAVATQVSTISGWTGTLRADAPATHIRQVAFALDSGVSANLQAADHYTANVVVDAPSGVLTFDGPAGGVYPFGGGGVRVGSAASYGLQSIMADYRAGYDAIPADIEQICREFAASMYQRQTGIGAIQSESIGSYSRSLADGQSFSDSTVAVLAKYSREVIA